MKLDELRQGVNSLWDSMADGWHRIRQSAAGALTRFKPGNETNLPEKGVVDDDFYLPSHGWSMLGGDVFEDERRVVVRLEVPGMEKNEFNIEATGDTLTVRGEKRFERETTDGRYRVLQCAYGSFSRVVPLRVPVVPDSARASYRNGVLKIELPKAAPGSPKGINIDVD